MQFPKILAVLAMLLATSIAAPNPNPNPNGALPATIFARGDNNIKCGKYSYLSMEMEGLAIISDCKMIIKNIRDGGTWTQSSLKNRYIVGYGHCVMKVGGGDGGSARLLRYYKIGNGDVINIIEEVIKQFGSGGKVGATGGMKCGAQKASWTLADGLGRDK